jgi:hypothetical protein
MTTSMNGRVAADVVKSLHASGLKVTLKELKTVLEITTPVTGRTIINGSDEELKKIVLDAKTKHVVTTTDTEAVVKAIQPKRSGRRSRTTSSPKLPTSNQPPRVKRTQVGVEAAAALMKFLEQYEVPAEFPINMTTFRKGGTVMVRAWTVDGTKVEISASEALENQGRRDEMAYAIPLFSEKVQNQIVTLVSKLNGAPSVGDRDNNNMKLFNGRIAWYYNMLQIGIRIWGGYENPPNLDISQFPHREFREGSQTRMQDITFRYRSVVVGFVAQIKAVFEEEALRANLSGSRVREYTDSWLLEFTSGAKKVIINGKEKSFLDFKVEGKQGSPEQFKAIWTLIKEDSKKRTPTRGSRKVR